jgi:hypothetical protein
MQVRSKSHISKSLFRRGAIVTFGMISVCWAAAIAVDSLQKTYGPYGGNALISWMLARAEAFDLRGASSQEHSRVRLIALGSSREKLDFYVLIDGRVVLWRSGEGALERGWRPYVIRRGICDMDSTHTIEVFVLPKGEAGGATIRVEKDQDILVSVDLSEERGAEGNDCDCIRTTTTFGEKKEFRLEIEQCRLGVWGWI